MSVFSEHLGKTLVIFVILVAAATIFQVVWLVNKIQNRFQANGSVPQIDDYTYVERGFY